MKRIIFLFLALTSIVSTLQAKPFDTETKTISLSAGYASRYGGTPVVLSFEHNLYNFNDKMGIRVGGIFGWSTYASNYTYYNGGWDYAYGKNRYNNLSMAFKGNYYYTGVKNFDFYAGIMAGYNVQIGATKWDDKSDKEQFGNKSNPKGSILFGATVGVRYEFTENIGAFVEGGYGLSYVSVGVSYRFRKQFFGEK